MKGRILVVRVLGSSIVGQLLDSLAFVFVACLFGVFAWELFLTLVLTNYLLKMLIETGFCPITLFAIRKLKKYEGVGNGEN